MLYIGNIVYTLTILQSDRPSSQYWNSGMVAANRNLSSELNLVISHMSELSSHNKVTIATYKITLNDVSGYC